MVYGDEEGISTLSFQECTETVPVDMPQPFQEVAEGCVSIVSRGSYGMDGGQEHTCYHGRVGTPGCISYACLPYVRVVT